MDIGDRLERLADELSRLAELPSVRPDELAELRAELLAIERAIVGPRHRAPAGHGARAKILDYLKSHLGQPVSGEQLREVSGIQEWARRVRELRVEYGYDVQEGGGAYTLVSPDPDEKVAARWALANRIRRMPGDARDRILEYFKANVGRVVTLAELHYVAKIKEVPRRVRELRDEFGYRISSRHDRPELRPDQYVLETLDPIPAAERQIRPSVWKGVIERDGHRCVQCGAIPGSGVWLEVDHIDEKADGGSDEPENLQTLCNRCHQRKTSRYQRSRGEARKA
jgi:biotin operon repressor